MTSPLRYQVEYCCIAALGMWLLAHLSQAHAVEAAQSPSERTVEKVDSLLSKRLPRVAPRSPQAALASFQVADGFLIELVAAEPLVEDPVAMAFDEHGRLYVVEMRDYSEQETERLGRVRLLTDEDQDGVFDHSDVFVDNLSWPTAVACYDGGVFVGAAPDILFLRDRDGDGKADEHRVVFSGLGRSNVQGLVNSFQWHLDHRIYVAVSSAGAALTKGPIESKSLDLRGRDFAFDPRTLEVEPITGGGQHGQCFNRWGDRFVCSNSDHLQAIVFEERYLARNPYQAVIGARRSIAADGPQAEVYRTSPIEPWRVVRTKLRVAGLVPGMIEGGGRAAGYFTSATGVTIDEGGLSPESYALIADVGSNLVHRKRMVDDGVTYRGERIDDRGELLTSTDNWFRPVQMCIGPEGAIYVADMYREVIEHPQSIPPEIKQQLDLTSGRDKGRIYRLLPQQFRQDMVDRHAFTTADDLTAALKSPNMWRRLTSLRLIWERSDKAVVPMLRELVQAAPLPETRVAALYGLESLDCLEVAHLKTALADSHPQVRRHALRLSEHQFDSSPELFLLAQGLQNDESAIVRCQLALSLGECHIPQRTDTLATLLCSSSSADLTAAVLTSASDCAGELLKRLAEHSYQITTVAGRQALTALAVQISRQAKAADIRFLEELLGNQREPNLDSPVAAILMALGPPQTVSSSASAARSSSSTRLDTVHRVALERYAAAARREFEATTLPERIAMAGQVLAIAGNDSDAELLATALGPGQSVDAQANVLFALRRQRSRLAVDVILASWDQLTPVARQAAMDVLCSREEWVVELIAALESERVHFADLSTATVVALSSYPNARVREQFAALRGRQATSDRQQVFQDYREVLDVAGSAQRGSELFTQHCASCHELVGKGNPIGPNLAAMANRGPEALLLNILVPNGELDPRYASYTLVVNDGRVLSGLIVSETATSVTLQSAGGEVSTVLRADIEDLQCSGLSLMPDGFERVLDKPGMADLLSYLLTSVASQQEVSR